MKKILALLAALGMLSTLAVSSCGDSKRPPITDGGMPDGGMPDGGVPDGGMPDGGTGPQSLASFVIELIEDYTTDTDEPFTVDDLDLTDSEDPNQFNALFQ
jgi:hypothetical protein